MSGSDYWKKQAKKNWNQRTYAWGQYFSMRDKNFELQQQIVERVDEIEQLEKELEENEPKGTNNHLIKFIRELYEKAKIEITCPICLERIEKDNLSTTSCGHNFCEDCLKQAKEACNDKHLPCPVCRKKIFV